LPDEPIIYEYESPITKIARQFSEEMIKNEENCLMVAVKESVGFDVDKDELLKALNYDREQYNKGYSDALRKLQKEIGDIQYRTMLCREDLEINIGLNKVSEIIDEMLGANNGK
jgi:hypothetical protein